MTCIGYYEWWKTSELKITENMKYYNAFYHLQHFIQYGGCEYTKV